MTESATYRPVTDGWLQSIVGMPLMELSVDGRIVAVNDNYCELVGRSRAQLLGHSPLEYTHPEDAAATHEIVSAQPPLGDGGRVLEKRYLRGDGQTIWVRVTAVWRPDQQRMLGYVADITDLMTARHRQRALFEHSADSIFVIDEGGRGIDMNPAARRLLGDPKGVEVAVALTQRAHPDDLDMVLAALSEVYTLPGLHPPVTFRLAGDDGEYAYLSVVCNNQLADPAVRGIVVNAHDVTHEARQLMQTERNQWSLVGALVRATEFRDPYTAGHQLKVADLSQQIGRRLGLPECEVREIKLGASLHDIGKIGVPFEILARPGPLSPPEFAIMRTHCEIGQQILTGVDLPPVVGDIVTHHHERLDGSGYPHGLSAAAISTGVRIVAVADVIDAMSSDRPYRPSLGVEAACAEISANQAKRYDPDVVAAALAIIHTSPPLAHHGTYLRNGHRMSVRAKETYV